ncbi:MAG: hypothetical protein KDI79_31760 [Anaerolineae bacterium]|nr:hypothetical protein [Anaerolineae bacterium]
MTIQTQQRGSPRRTLIMGLGGTGHRSVVHLKGLVEQSWPKALIAQRVRYLVFDTADETVESFQGDRAVSLENESELVNIGNVPVAKIKQNLSHQAAIEARLGGVIAQLPPSSLRRGAKQLRPLGLLAMLWHYATVEERLREAIWALAGRQEAEQQEGINVFIFSSLVGGTGSSMVVDMAHLVRDLLDELGILADFCYVTGVGVLPRAFQGIDGPNLIPNAVATLKEINHTMMQSGFEAHYPNGRSINTAQPPFNIVYLLDGIDERGHTWTGPGEVCRLAAEAIYLQMGSQIGQKHENDFDNLDDVLVQQTAAGDGTFYGSLGLAALVFNGPAVADRCAARQARRVIDQGLLAPVTAETRSALKLDQPADQWLEAAHLTLPALLERLAVDDHGAPVTVEVTTPGWVSRLADTAVPRELIRYVAEYQQTRLNTDFRRVLQHNETRLITRSREQLAAQLDPLLARYGLSVAEAWLKRLAAQLDETVTRLERRLAEAESRQAELAQELSHLELVFLQAGESGFLGRSRRISRAQHSYMTTAQQSFELWWTGQIVGAARRVAHEAGRAVQAQADACRAVQGRLQAVQHRLKSADSSASSPPLWDGVTTRSLATNAFTDLLFEGHAPAVPDTLAALFSGGASPLAWQTLSPADIEAILYAACRPPFEAIGAMTVEQAITLQSETLSSEGFRVWLVNQATPSWNLDRTRLPDGGAGLKRLEVLGVPDETRSIYHHHARSLVSTGDKTRVIAFVARVGAPHTATQQWASYLAVYQQARGRVPLHVLPQFQSDGQQARQTFALGSLFGFITSQGSYFYYTPDDQLDRPQKLGQGLSNSLESFTRRTGLVQEVRARVEKRVAQQGLAATLTLLEGYYQAQNGQADETVLDLKRLVRDYAAELRQIYQFTSDAVQSPSGPPPEVNHA